MPHSISMTTVRIMATSKRCRSAAMGNAIIHPTSNAHTVVCKSLTRISILFIQHSRGYKINQVLSREVAQTMIHLVAGQSALGTLEETSVPGEKFSIDDILMEGPIVDGLHSESSWEKRAGYLERYFSIS